MVITRASGHYCIAIAALMLCAGTACAADDYPSKPVRLILPFGAGGSTDIVGRIFAQRFSEAFGQTVVVDNRAGAAGIIGTELGARSVPDGYTIMTYGINQAITATLYKKLPYHHLRDFTPISLYATMPNILCVTPSLPVADVSEFVKFMKASPGKYKFASSGVGASPHLTMEYFMARTGLNLIHVPYKNSSQGYTDTMSGEVQAFFFNLPGPLTHVRAGRLRALAVTSAKRTPLAPDLPAIDEELKGYELIAWFALMAPAGTPKEVVQALHDATVKGIAKPEVREKFAAIGTDVAPLGPDELARFIQSEIAAWAKLVKLAGIQPE